MKTLITTTAVVALASLGTATTASASDCKSNWKTASHHSTMSQPDIVQTAVAVDDLSTLVAAVKAAGLVDALSGDGPLTVFAPTNAAFDGLPSGTVETLLRPENKSALTRVLTSHVVAGDFDAGTLIAAARANGGTAEVETLSGATLTAVLAGDTLYVKDEQGGLAEVAQADVQTSNGVVHVVTRVLQPGQAHTS